MLAGAAGYASAYLAYPVAPPLGVVTPWVAPFSITVPDLVYAVLLVPGGFFSPRFLFKKILNLYFNEHFMF
jgi:hypothetical protein